MNHYELLRKALKSACSRFVSEVADVPIEYWNESVFRHLLVRELLTFRTREKVWSEWHRVDLVLPDPSGGTAIELKFYTRNPLCAVPDKILRWKGGPSEKNYGEFRRAIERLADSTNRPWAKDCGDVEAAYLVLAYFDRTILGNRQSYEDYYGDLGTNEMISAVETITDKKSIDRNTVFTCKLVSINLK
jgi:hypothetical protein